MYMPKSAITISDDGSLVQKIMLSCLLNSVHKPRIRSTELAEDRKVNDKGRCNILRIHGNGIVIMQVLHPGQHETGHKTKPISLSLLPPGEKRSNVRKHCYGISFR
jgi:hypothetical protein